MQLSRISKAQEAGHSEAYVVIKAETVSLQQVISGGQGLDLTTCTIPSINSSSHQDLERFRILYGLARQWEDCVCKSSLINEIQMSQIVAGHCQYRIHRSRTSRISLLTFIKNCRRFRIHCMFTASQCGHRFYKSSKIAEALQFIACLQQDSVGTASTSLKKIY